MAIPISSVSFSGITLQTQYCDSLLDSSEVCLVIIITIIVIVIIALIITVVVVVIFIIIIIIIIIIIVKGAGATTRHDSPFQGTWKVNPEYLESL